VVVLLHGNRRVQMLGPFMPIALLLHEAQNVSLEQQPPPQESHIDSADTRTKLTMKRTFISGVNGTSSKPSASNLTGSSKGGVASMGGVELPLDGVSGVKGKLGPGVEVSCALHAI
jgi:hypothetical protein